MSKLSSEHNEQKKWFGWRLAFSTSKSSWCWKLALRFLSLTFNKAQPSWQGYRLSGIIDVVFENKLRNERAEKLKNWFPQCECQICSGPAPQLEKSDQTRENLALLHNEVFLYIFLILKDCKILRQGESAEQEGQIEGGHGSRTEEGPTHWRTGGRACPAGDYLALTKMK